ncbi:unnamed protein product [Diamesa tonsa]
MIMCKSDFEANFTDDFVSLQIKCLKFIYCHRAAWRFTKYIVIFFSLSTCFSIISEAFYVVINYKDILEAADAVGAILTGFLGIVKYFTFLKNKSGFYKLMDKLNELSIKNLKMHSKILHEANKLNNRITKFNIIITVFTAIGYCLVPIISNVYYHVIKGGVFLELMPTKAAFPYDISISPNYEFSYILICVAMFCIVFSSISVDSLFIGFCLNICAHFQIIRSSTFKEDFNYKSFIKCHQEIIVLCNDLNEIYVPVIFTQFLVCSVLLCGIGFQLVMTPDIFKILVLLAFSSAILIQLFIYAYGGTLIMEESGAVADNIYSKELLLSIQIANKKRCIKSGFYTASLPTFVTIISSAGSYITLLQSLAEKN